MADWNTSSHPISDIRDWNIANRLELRPDYQRREVWSMSAKVMLIDTILKRIPMPKIILSNEIREGQTHRTVIDGQQRISSILSFLNDEFELDSPIDAQFQGQTFSGLEPNIQEAILHYSIDFNEAINATDEEIREVYSRVNKYTVPLTKQELRRADYPGDFLKAVEKWAVLPFFDDARVFTAAARRRYADAEYVSELVASMIGGVQDKKETLDDFYKNFREWDENEYESIRTRFENALEIINIVFNEGFEIRKTRYRQKADFYTLFYVVDELRKEAEEIQDVELEPLRSDLELLDTLIRPTSEVALTKEFAIKCVSQANSRSSRKWRSEFLSSIFTGTFGALETRRIGTERLRELAYQILADPEARQSLSNWFSCISCGSDLVEDENSLGHLVWRPEQEVFQISNSFFVCDNCLEKGDWLRLQPVNDEG